MNSFHDGDSLRPGQLGTLHALKAHFLGSHKKTVAQVHLPTGYGKTMVMLLAKHLLAEGRQTLVVCGTEVLREQLRRNFAAFANEKTDVAEGMPYTARIARRAAGLADGQPQTKSVFTKIGVDGNDLPPLDADVVVALPQSLNTYAPQDGSGRQAVGLILIDEGHHVPARTWAEIVKRNPDAKVVVFTATPFRHDGLPLPGRLVFTYTLADAIREGSITDAAIHAVTSAGAAENVVPDEKLARKALEILRACRVSLPQAKLLVKCNDIEKSERLADLYRAEWGNHDGDNALLVLHSGLKVGDIRSRLTRLDNNEFAIVIAVNMLSEGLDNPYIRVLAVHDNLPDLGHFVQVAGRVSRTVVGSATASSTETAIDSHVVLFEDHLPEAVRETMIPQKLSDLSSAVSGRIFKEELRTWLQEHLDEGTIPTETVYSVFENARLREYTRIYEIRVDDAVDWSSQLGKSTRPNLVGYYSHQWTEGRLQVGLGIMRKPNAWLGDLDVPATTLGMVLTYEPKRAADKDTRLLFVTATAEHRNFIDELVEALNRQGARVVPLGLPKLKRLYSDHERVSYFNLGLRSRLRSPLVERYRIIAGAEIELALDSSVAHGFAQGHVIGRMFDTDEDGDETGTSEILGISSRSTVWGGGTRKAEAICRGWMAELAKRIWSKASTLSSALERVPTGDSVDVATIPTGAGGGGFWGQKTAMESVTLVADADSHVAWNNLYLSQAYLDGIRVTDPEKTVNFAITFRGGGPVTYPDIAVCFDPQSHTFTVTPSVRICRASGETQPLSSWLRIDPPALFLKDGSCLQGQHLIAPAPAGSALEFINDALFTMNWTNCDVTAEKPPGFEVDKTKKKDPTAPPQSKIKDYDPRLRADSSIFTFVANALIARVENKTLVAAFCDDDAYELADFIAIRAPDAQRLVVELYLCKKTSETEPGLRTLEVAELWAQALRASQLLTKESLANHLRKREMARMRMAPDVKTAKAEVERLLNQTTSVEFEIILVQPGLDLNKLTAAVSGKANSKNTIAHAFPALSAGFQRRGVRLLIVGRESNASATRAAKRTKKVFPDIFLRPAT